MESDPPSLMINEVNNEDDNEVNDTSDCSICIDDNPEACDTCIAISEKYEYTWEDYSTFNNCRSGDCKECIQHMLVGHGYCVVCFQKDCMGHSTILSKCQKCDSPYECVCDMLISHGHCPECLYEGGECICK